MISTDTLNEWKFPQSNTKLKSQVKVKKSKVKENESNTFIMIVQTGSWDFYRPKNTVEITVILIYQFFSLSHDRFHLLLSKKLGLA